MVPVLDRYIEVDGKPVRCDDLAVWAQWYEANSRIVERTEIGDEETGGETVTISTVFLAMDHNMGFGDRLDPRPVLYETLIFGGEHDNEMWRYCTREEAKRGHAKAVQLVTGFPRLVVNNR